MNGSLNRIFRVVWNAVLGEWQVASEHTKGRGKTKSVRLGGGGFARLTAGSILVLFSAGALAELPTGGQVTAGSGQINTPSNGHMVINQNSNKMVIDWTSYSIGSGNSVQYIQPSADAIALNRVLGGDPSIIRGTISANGRVVLLNPNGILFGPTSKVEVASLLASTLNMSNEDFMAGNFNLTGNSTKSVINQGSIKAADGGFVALVAAKIENVGDISVRGGEVLMGSGRKVRLDLGGPAKIEVDEAVVDGYIRNGGLIKAEGGSVVMTVKTANDLATLAINNEGIIEATSMVRGDGGKIQLLADGGAVTNSGTLNVSAAEGKGGYVEVTGTRVGMLDGSVVDASGATGGGTVLLGGDYQGKNAAVNNAQMTFVGANATVRANATQSGDGGKVIVWADDRTAFSGTIEAKGGAEGGNGGLVEVSGKQFLDFQGSVDTTAAKGKTGSLLLDPTNLTIGKVNSSSWITQNGTSFADFTANTNPDPAHDFSFLRVDVLEAALSKNDITVLSACQTAQCVGTITVKDAVTWNSGKGLTLDATGSIFINADITSVGANGVKGGNFNAIAASGNIAVNANITTVGGTALSGAGLAGGSVNLNAATGSVVLSDHAVINTSGSAAATGSVAAGGAAGSININSTTGITLNNGDLIAAGGASTSTVGAGGLIHLSTTSGNVTQGNDSRIVGGKLQLETDTGSVTLNSGKNEVAAIAARSNSGNIAFTNLNTVGLTVTDIGGVSGVATGGTGSVNLSARNLQINSGVSTNTGAITLNASHGQQAGDFSGVVINAANVTTQGGSISVTGRGGDAASGNQTGVVVKNGATVNAGGTGSVTVTGQGGTSSGDRNHGVVVDGGVIATTGTGAVSVTGSGGAGSDSYGVLLAGSNAANTGMITSSAGAITVNATGGAGGDNNHAIAFEKNGQIGDTSGNRNVTINTTVGTGTNSVAYAGDTTGGYIGTGSGSLTLGGNVLSTNRVGAVAVRSTGDLKLQSLGSGFSNTFNLAAFTGNFLFNGGGTGFNSIGNLTVGKSGSTSDIVIDQALSLAGRSVSLNGSAVTVNQNIGAGSLTVAASGDVLLNKQINTTGAVQVVTSAGDVRLNDQVTAGTKVTLNAADGGATSGGNVIINQQITATDLSITASKNITQTVAGGFAVTSADFTSTKGNIELDGQNNQTTNLTATASDGAIKFNNGTANALNLNGTLTAKSVHLKAKSLNQTGGTITADALEVMSSHGSVLLDRNNNVKTVAANVTGGDFTFNNNGNPLAIGTVDTTTGVRASGKVTFNSVKDLEIGATVNASDVVINAWADRTINLGSEEAGQLSLTNGEINQIAATSLTLNTTGQVLNSANVRAGGLSAMTIVADKGIVNSGAGQLGFSGRENGALTLTTKGTDADQGIGSASNALVTIGTSSLTLSSARDIRVDARKNGGGSGSADLDKLYINSTSYGANYSYGVASTAGLTLTSGTAPGWYQGTTPLIKGSYNIRLNPTDNTRAFDFRFVGNAPINVSGASNIGAANFWLESIYGIKVGNSITGTSGAINLKANSGNTQAGDFIGVDVTAGITTGSGSIVIDGRGGSGRNAGDFNTDQSDQHGVNIANTVSATAGGSISITGNGGSSGSNGVNHDGVVISGAVTGTGGNIAINGAGGSGGAQGTANDGIVFNGSGYVSNATGNVSLTGKSGSGTNSRAIAQDGSGIITASGLEVISTQSGEVDLTNDNKVGVLAGNVTTGFYFDNGGRTGLSIGRVNNSVGLSGSGTIGLYDIAVLSANESIQASGANLAIATDAIFMANGKSIRGGNVWLTGKTDKGASWNPTASSVINIGASGGGGVLGLTSGLLDNIYASSQLTLATTGDTTITADTFFKNTNSLALRSGGTITSTGTNWLVMSGSNNQGSLSLTGSTVGQDNRDILVQGANKIAASSTGVINVRAFTQGGGGLIDLKSVSITSNSGGADLKYRVEGAGLSYGLIGNGSSYALAANATNGNTVDFSFSGNASTTVSSSDMNGGAFSAQATSGNLTVADATLIRASNVALKSAGNITLAGSAAVNATGSASFVSSGTNSIFATGTGNVNAGSNIEIKTDAVTLGSGLLTAATEISVNPVTTSRLIQLGGGDDSNLSLSAAELAQMSANKLVIGRNSVTDQISSAISIAGAVDLSNKFSTLSLNSYNSGGVTQSGALTVNNLDVSLNSGNVTLSNIDNNVRVASVKTDGTVRFANTGALTFSSVANGLVNVTNDGSLNVAGINSNGGAITVSSTGDLLVSSAVTATETANGADANGAAISLESTQGSLTVNAGITSNGFSASGNSAQNGGSISLRGQNVTIGSGSPVSITANGIGAGNSTATGGGAGSVTITSTQADGDVVLTNATLTATAGSGGYASGGGTGGAAGTVTLTAAAGGNVSLSGGGINLSGAGGGGTAGRGGNAGTLNLNTSGGGAVSATNTSITLNGGAGAGTGNGGNAGTVTATGSNVALTGTTVSLNGGNGGGTDAGGSGGIGGNLTVNSATGGEVRLSNSNIYLNGGNGAGTAGNGGAAGALSIPTVASAKTVLKGGLISLVGGSAGTNGARGNGHDLTFNNQVVLGAGSFDINAGGGNVRFTKAVDGDVSTGTLTIRSSRTSGGTTTYGNLTFDQAIGATTAIGNLSANSIQNVVAQAINASGNVSLSAAGNATVGAVNAGSLAITNVDGTTTLNGAVQTTNSNGININSKTLVANGVGYTTTGGGDIVLATKDALNLLNTQAFISSGFIDLKATDGITISGSSLTTGGKGIIFRSATALASDVSVDTTNGGAVTTGGDVLFLGTLNSDNMTRNLTVTAGSGGSVNFGAAVGGTKALGDVTIVSAKNVSLSGMQAASFTQQAGTGTTTVNGATNGFSGAFAFTGNALTINGGLSASQVTIDNADLFTAAAGSNITATNGFTQTGNGAATLGGSITTTEADIRFASPVTVGGTVALSTGATGNGDIRFADKLDNSGAGNTGSTTLTAGAGRIVFGGNIGSTAALGDLTVRSTQDVELPVSVTANSLTIDGGGSTTFKNNAVITTVGKQEYSGAAKLAGNTTLASGGNVIFSDTVNGGYNLTVNAAGITRFGGAVGNTTALNNLVTDANGTVEINGGGVTTVGNQNYGDQLTLGADATLTSTNGGNITFGKTVNGARALTVATNGITTFHGAVGSVNALSSITVANQAGSLLLNGTTFRTTGAQNYNSGKIILGGDTLLASSVAGTINLGGDVDAAICTIAALDVQTQGATIFGGAVGSYRPLWSITTDGAPSATNTVTFQQGTVITHGDQRYGETVILGADTKLTSYNQGKIEFGGPVRAAVDGQQSLTIATSGDITFQGPVGDNNQRLASLDTSLSKDGNVLINGGTVTTKGGQEYGGAVQLGTNTVLESTDSGNIVFDGTVDGAHDLTIATDGTTQFKQLVGGTTELAKLTTSGNGAVVISGGGVKTSGDQIYDKAVVLGANTVISTSNGGEVSFNRTVDGPYALSVNAGGDTTFNGAVGGSSALASISTDADGKSFINGGLVRTTGAQTFNDGITVGADTVFTSAGGPITFNDTLDGPHDVTVRTPGVTTFGDAVGKNSPLKNLYGGTGRGSINIMGPSIALTGSLIFEEPVRVYGATKVDVGGDALFYGDARVGKSLLDVTAGGRIQYGRPVDNIKNYLPTLFTMANQNAGTRPALNDLHQPVSVALVGDAGSRQLAVGALQMVDLTASAPGGTTGGLRVDEGSVNQAVNEIVRDDTSRSTTFVVTVNGGVREANDSM
jgi:filamentous hemagglutinin family protein